MSKEIRTCESLALDIDTAEKCGIAHLLPKAHLYSGDVYPLPTETADLCRIANLRIPGGGGRKDGSRAYILRCRKQLNRRDRALAASGARAQINRLRSEVNQAHTILKRRREEADALVQEVRDTVTRLYTSMNEVFELSKQGQKRLMDAWMKGEELNDEKVTHSHFLTASRAVQAAVKALGGVAPEDSKESEDAVFNEWQETRKRVATAQRPLKGPEEPQ